MLYKIIGESKTLFSILTSLVITIASFCNSLLLISGVAELCFAGVGNINDLHLFFIKSNRGIFFT